MKLLLDEFLVLRAASSKQSILTAKVRRTTGFVGFWQGLAESGRIAAKTTFWQDTPRSGLEKVVIQKTQPLMIP
jgi:hypothetical protein